MHFVPASVVLLARTDARLVRACKDWSAFCTGFLVLISGLYLAEHTVQVVAYALRLLLRSASARTGHVHLLDWYCPFCTAGTDMYSVPFVLTVLKCTRVLLY
eukprot:595254-Rhodomonas_salina.1